MKLLQSRSTRSRYRFLVATVVFCVLLVVYMNLGRSINVENGSLLSTVRSDLTRHVQVIQNQTVSLVKDEEIHQSVSLNQKNETAQQEDVSTTKIKEKPKTILLYNSFWGEKAWGIGYGDTVFRGLNCEVQNCKITDNRAELETSDALLFHIHELGLDKPKRYSVNQRWVFWMLEGPGWSRNLNYAHWNGYFNWTMTYRKDSDLKLLYGEVEKRKAEEEFEKNWNEEKWNAKSKKVAWMVTNCGDQQSRRGTYIDELKKYINVDIYGPCGSIHCPKTNWEACMEEIERDYKFYLAFENAFCKDYVTEKFFKVLPRNVIPIIGKDMGHSTYAPNSWYINAEDYESPQQLAEHMHKVGNNFTLYTEYLSGRERYRTGDLAVKRSPSWCELCRKLHNSSEPVKVYDSIATWWSKNDCVAPYWPRK